MKRRNIWGQCSIYKQIFLPPKIVVFPLELIDEIILHEMSHLKLCIIGNNFGSTLVSCKEEMPNYAR